MASIWLYFRKFLLSCSCLYLFSAAGSTDVAIDGELRKKRFSRTAAAAAAETPVEPNEVESVSIDSRSSTVIEPSPMNPISLEEVEEEFDYETYHTKHHIPVPALGATMMGLLNTANTGNTNTDTPPQHRILEEELSVPRGILAFAGTNAAMKSLASETETDQDIFTEGTSSLYGAEEEEGEPPPSKNTNIMSIEKTLAQISKSRFSLLYGSGSSEEVGKGNTSGDITTVGDSLLQGNDPANNDALLKTKPQSLNNGMPKLNGSDSDLDRGRHMVGLEVRDVRPHQQIIIDYATDSDSEEQLMRPLRIKYFLSDNVEFNAGANKGGELENNVQLLSTLLDTSFNRTASLWSQALSLPPVMNNIIPTVEKCGSARIPALHREKGVGNTDIVIYVSNDNKYCGGALMHSAICDFDQNMRPLVSNINICTKNIPLTTLLDYDVQEIRTGVSNEYDGYISTETSRILGASTSLFRNFQNPDTGAPYGSSEKHADCVDGTQETVLVPNIIREDIDSNTGQVYYEIRTPKVVEVVRNQFDCMTLTGARLEVKKGGLSCFGGFLDERLFFGEQVLGFQVVARNQGTHISPLTLALLEDSSWYIANYTVSSEISFGRDTGCQFARGGCAIDDTGNVQVSSEGRGFHCEEIGKMGCDISHSFKAKCDLLHSTSTASLHGFPGGYSSHSDVCPMYIRGSIDCAQGTDFSPALPGEVYGQSSKCFLTDEGDPICLEGKCRAGKRIDVRYKDEVFTCAHDGQIIDTMKGLRIVCPRIAAICPSLICPSNCSGRGVCDEDSCICDDPFDETPGCWGQ